MTNPRTRVGSFRLNKSLELEFGFDVAQSNEIVFFIIDAARRAPSKWKIAICRFCYLPVIIFFPVTKNKIPDRKQFPATRLEVPGYAPATIL